MMTHTRLRKTQKLLLLLFTICLLLITLLLYHQYHETVQETVSASVPLSNLKDDTIYLYGYLPSTSDTIGNDAVSWWYCDQDQFYYFFLPSEAKSVPVHIAFSSNTADTIIWGDQTYHSGDVVSVLTDGLIAIVIGDKTYPVNVLYGDQVSTMMIQTDTHSMDSVDSDMTIREGGLITISDSTSSYYYDGELTYIKGRGNSSFGYDKKSYQIKLPQKQDVCGMNSAKKWVLLPQLLDKTSVRNPVTFGIADALGLQYTPDYRYVNLYLNGSYHGLYLLTEKVEVSQERIKIRDLDQFLKEAQKIAQETTAQDTASVDSSSKVESSKEESLNEFETFGESDYKTGTCKGYLTGITPSDITGGYLLELELPERYSSAGHCGFVTTHGQAVIIKSPEYASKEEVEYISSWYQEFEDALYADDGMNPKTGLHYSDYIDMDSLVEKYLVEEYVLNPDAGKTSQFFYKANDSISKKAFAGPVWDYDLALGGLVAFSHPEGLWAAYPDEEYNIYYRLSQHNDFMVRTREIYQNTLLPYLTDTLPAFIQEQEDFIRFSSYMSAIRWNYYEKNDLETFAENYSMQFQSMNAFLDARASFLSNLWLNGISYHTVSIDSSECDYFYLGTDNRFTIQDGNCIQLFYDPVQYGYTFAGFVNKDTGEPFDLSTPITVDGLSLKPVFTK